MFKGYEQEYRKDYTSTTSPTAQMESWRILLHIAMALGWDAQQIDVKTAFLYGLLPNDKVQYMERLKGFEEEGKETWVWKLQRGIYGMKQAGRIWNKMVNDVMLSWEFTQLACESCIYYCKNTSGIIISAIHIDNFLSVTNPLSENAAFKAQMKQIWTISDLGEACFCVGIAISCDKEARTVSLSQTALIDRVVTQFSQQDTYPMKTSMDPGLKLRHPSDVAPSDQAKLSKYPYRSLVSCLLYLCITTRYHLRHSTTLPIPGFIFLCPLECRNSHHLISKRYSQPQTSPRGQ